MASRLLRAPFDTDAADTVGGYVYHLLGRIPTVGETVRDDLGFEFRIAAMTGSRIQTVHVYRIAPRDDDKSEASSQ